MTAIPLSLMLAGTAETTSEPGLPASAAPRLRAAFDRARSHCVRCGFCLPVCPTYQVTGKESASPRGRLDLMAAVSRGELSLVEIRPAMETCLGCLACQTACPSNIAYGDGFEGYQADVATAQRPSRAVRILLGPVLGTGWLRWLIAAGAALYRITGTQRILRRSGLLGIVPRLAHLDAAAPPVPWPSRWQRAAARWHLVTTAAPPPTAAYVGLLRGCVMDTVFGSAHLATVKVLKRQGLASWAPDRQACCGALQWHAGELQAGRDRARRNIAAFEPGGDEPIVVNSAGCGAAMKSYGEWLADDPQWAPRARRFADRVCDISEYLAGRLTAGTLTPMDNTVKLRAAYDDPCHLVHAQGVREEPRKLLAQVPGLTLVNLPEADRCCGSAGSFSLQQPAMSQHVLKRKLDQVTTCEIDVLVNGNPGCLLQLAAGIQRRGLGLRVLHPMELLARGYGDPQ